MNFSRLWIVAILAALMTSCGSPSIGQIGILPTECALEIGSQMPLALDGHIADSAVVVWQADRGSIAYTGQGLNALYTAPQTPGDANISAIITSGTPIPQSLTRTCHVVDDNAKPTSTNSGNSSPTNTFSVKATSTTNLKNVIISEVMGNPCGGDEFRKWNDYVELYNNGDQPQDVGGLWLTVGGSDNKSDKLVSWDARNPEIPLGSSVITNTTIISQHRFAVVLSPIYTKSLDPYRTPYRFPQGTIILTIANGDRIGHPYYGIIGQGDGRDVMVLYQGGAKSILEVISTYGTPILGRYPQDVHDNRTDNVPLDLHACSSAERINPLGPDTFENWREVQGGSPGEAPYLP